MQAEFINPDFLAIAEEQKPETDDQRLQRILAEAKASVAKSEEVLKKCENESAQTENALRQANTALENVESFKDVWRQLNNRMIDQIGQQMRADRANGMY